MARSRRRMILGLSAAGVVAAGGAGAGVALAATSTTPIQAIQFQLRTSGFTETFTSCTGLGSISDVGSSTTTSGKIVYVPGATHYDNIVCTRPLSTDLTLEAWRGAVINNSSTAKTSATLVTLDQSGVPSATWSLAGVWPNQLQDTPVAGSSVMKETVTLVVDKQVRVSN